MAIDWGTVVATIVSGLIGASGAVFGVWLTTKSTRKLNEENRIKDKKQELIVALAKWRGYLSKLMPEIKKLTSEPLLSPDNDPLTTDLELCIFLLQEYEFIPDSLRVDFAAISNLLISMANVHQEQDYEVFIERIKSIEFSRASEKAKSFYAEFISWTEHPNWQWEEWSIESADDVFGIYIEIEEKIYRHLINR